MKKLLVILALVGLTGCATNDYKLYAQAQAQVATAKANAEGERFKALSNIATNGTESSKIAAVMALALGNNGQSNAPALAAPAPNEALQWASILVPSLTNIAGMHYNSKVSMATIDTNARIAESTNSTFSSIASKIQAPVAPAANVSNVTTTTTTSNANQANVATTTSSANQANTTSSSTTTNANPTTTTISGTGSIGGGTVTTAANPTTTTTTTNPATQIPAGAVCSVSATGVLSCNP